MAAPFPLLFRVYRGAGRILGPALRGHLARRHAAAGGPPDRLGERFGHASRPRPEGRLVWVHAVSVGEALSVIDLLPDLAARAGATILLTTTTVTSAGLVAGRLPEGVIHQFGPADTVPSVARFLDHWRPDLAVYTESEFWPVQVDALHRRAIPVTLVNGRLSDRSARGWARAPRLIAALLDRYALLLCQDERTADALRRLGAPEERVHPVGTLKAAADPLPVDEGERERLSALVADRPVWCAASTHPGEEEAILAAHAEVRKTHPEALLILAIRHPDRGGEVAGKVSRAGLAFTRRSSGSAPEAGTAVLLADTLGEMGLWFSLAPVVFMGGSLREGIGGHNPYEPAHFGCAILSGPHVANAESLYDRLVAAGAARLTSAPDLGGSVAALLSPGSEAGRMGEAARAAASRARGLRAEVAGMLAALIDGGRP